MQIEIGRVEPYNAEILLEGKDELQAIMIACEEYQFHGGDTILLPLLEAIRKRLKAQEE